MLHLFCYPILSPSNSIRKLSLAVRKTYREYVIFLAGILIYSLHFLVLMPDKEEKRNSDKKIRKMAIDIVNELLKSGQYVRVDISTGSIIEKCGPKFAGCGDYKCPKTANFKCQATPKFDCIPNFTRPKDFVFSV
jgi:hypothetical protein